MFTSRFSKRVNKGTLLISVSLPEVGESHSARKVRTLGCLNVFNLFTADLTIVMGISSPQGGAYIIIGSI